MIGAKRLLSCTGRSEHNNLIIHDDFTGVSASMVGRVPNLVNNGNTWYSASPSSSIMRVSGSGWAGFVDIGGKSWMHIDTGVPDYTLECYSIRGYYLILRADTTRRYIVGVEPNAITLDYYNPSPQTREAAYNQIGLGTLLGSYCTLKLRVSGDTLTVYINGDLKWTTPMLRFSGNTHVGIHSPESNGSAFDYFKVWI